MLTLTDNFKQGVLAKQKTYFPLVLMTPSGSNTPEVFLSNEKRKFYIDGLNIDSDVFFEDRNMEISDISEEIDIGADRAFTIGEVNIFLSNYVINNIRFSEKFANKNFIGGQVSIYIANPACKQISDCMLMYRGFITNFELNSEDLNFTLQDYVARSLSSKYFPKRVTQNPSAEQIEANKFLHFPAIYGTVERAKLLFSRPVFNAAITKIYSDATFPDSGIKIAGFVDSSPLKIFRDDMYLPVPNNIQQLPHDLFINGFNYSQYTGQEQYRILNDTIVLEKIISDFNMTRNVPLNLNARDQLQIDASRTASSVRAFSTSEILEYGTQYNDDGSVQKVEFMGHKDGYNVLEGATTWSFPDNVIDGQEVISAGYYENLVISNIWRRNVNSSYYANKYKFEDSGSFWMLNHMLHYSEVYDMATSEGAVDIFKYPLEEDILTVLKLPPNTTVEELLVEEKPYGEFDTQYGYGWDAWAFPFYTPYSLIHMGDSSKRENMHSVLYNLEGWRGEMPKSFWYGTSVTYPTADWRSWYYWQSQSYNEWSHTDYDQMRMAPTDNIVGGHDNNTQYTIGHWIVTSPNGGDWGSYPEEGSYDGINQVMPRNSCIGYKVVMEDAAAEEFYGVEGYQAIKDAFFTHMDVGAGSLEPFYGELSDPARTGMTINFDQPLPVNMLHEGSHEWKTQHYVFDELVYGDITLTELLYGRRITVDENTQTGIPLGTFVYGYLPVLGYSVPKAKSQDSVQSTEIDTSVNEKVYRYSIAFDSLYCYGNPYWHGLNNNQDYITDVVDEGLASNVKIYHLNRIEIEETLDVTNNDIGWRFGLHDNYGTTQWDIYKDIHPCYPYQYPYDLGEASGIFPNVTTIGQHAIFGGNYCPLSYSQGLIKAAKMDIGFNSITGSDVIQGGVVSKLTLKAEVDFYSQVDIGNEDNQVKFLVECDAFKLGGNNNIIEHNVDGSAIVDDDGNISNITLLSTGNPVNQGDSNRIFTSSTLLATNGSQTIVATPNIFEVTEDDLLEDPNAVNTWRNDLNSVNNIALTFKIDRDLTENDYDENGEPLFSSLPIVSWGAFYVHLSEITLQQRFIVGNVSNLDYYASVKGRIDEWQESDEYDYPMGIGKYTGKVLNYNSATKDNWMIQNPVDVLSHIIEKEFDYVAESPFDIQSIENARSVHSDWKFDFSLSEKTDAFDFINDFTKSTFFTPRFRYDGTFSYVPLQREVISNAIPIKNEDVIKFDYSKTPIEQVKLKVNVNYGWDEGLNSYVKSTNLGNGGAVPVEWQELKMLYNISSVDDAYLVVESKYIQDDATAISLRNRLLSFYKNQHSVISLSLPFSYIHLECGDAISFEELIFDVTMFGNDYTQSSNIFNQEILPYFVITSVSKSMEHINITAIQVHQYDAENVLEEDPNVEDTTQWFIYDIVEDSIEEEPPVVDDGLPDDVTDEIIMPPADADLDGNGLTNILDIIMVISYIIGSDAANANPENWRGGLYNADMNEDGFVDILDVVALIQMLLAGELND